MLPFAHIHSNSTDYDFYIFGSDVIVSGKYLHDQTQFWSELYSSVELFFNYRG